jgi:penicillin amidase
VPDEAPARRRAKPPSRLRRWLKRLGLGLVFLIGLLLVIVAAAGFWVRSKVKASLPEVEGERRVTGLAAAVTIERDALGIPTIRGASRRDVAYATGFVHAQDRFFQMDLLRRQSAGELAELFGPAVLPADRGVRVHRFRAEAERLLWASRPEIRAVLEGYAEGVNAGLASLGAPPFEYLAIRASPAPWRAEDSFLVLFSMFMQLQDEEGNGEAILTQLHDSVPAPLYAFLTPTGTEWDAPMVGGPVAPPPLPGPEVCNVHAQPVAMPTPQAASAPGIRSLGKEAPLESSAMAGSNGWAVAGSHTASGGALLTNELHLPLIVPNIWYRTSLSWPDGAGGQHTVTGVTLPGAPAMVLGSNGHVAWGVTNSTLDTTDLVPLEVDASRPGTYLTPQGPQRFQRVEETLRVKGGGAETLDIYETIWGPVVGNDWLRRPVALRWVAHEPGAVDFEILGLETAPTLQAAFDIAHRSGVPALNFLAADDGGHVGWTILGRIPRRVGFDGHVAASWADGTRSWAGLLPPEEVPQILDPESGRVWNANNRSVDGEMLDKLGGGFFVFGARARQIRDDLFAVEKATPDDMRKIELDDRAVFLQHWHDLLLKVLTPEAVAADPRRRELRDVVEHWGGHAAVDSAGYRMVRGYRLFLGQAVFRPILSACGKLPESFPYYGGFEQSEGPLWSLVSQQPAHLLDPRYKTWQELFLAAADTLVAYYPPGSLSQRTWGEFNTLRIQHPISQAVPFLGRWLDMPRRPMPGDADMPRVLTINFGPTLRMVVSPGREKEGYFHMPGGQSGNPLSDHYADGLDAWAEGKPTPFLPGAAVATMRLVPGG